MHFQQVIETKTESRSSEANENSTLEEIKEETISKPEKDSSLNQFNPFSALDDLESDSKKPSISKSSLHDIKKTQSYDSYPDRMSYVSEPMRRSGGEVLQKTKSGPGKYSLHHKTTMKKLALQLQSLENKQYIVNNGKFVIRT